MFFKPIASTCLVAAITLMPVTRATADAGDALAGALVGGIIGHAIAKDQQRQRTVVTRKVYVPAKPKVNNAVRNQNRETQTSLNYFGFPAGTADGVMGRNSRAAVAQYQAHMGFPATGQLTIYERDFLVGSYQRAMAGGILTSQQIAGNPMGSKGLLHDYRAQAMGQGAVAPVTAPAPIEVAATPEPAAPALPNFMGGDTGVSLASHCNKVSLVTNTNGGFTTLASMTDPDMALGEQFCLARTYAIASGEELAARVQGVSATQMEAQCAQFGPAMQPYVAAMALNPSNEVLSDVGKFILGSGMSPEQMAGTARICLSVGYRTDNMDVAMGSALLLTALGDRGYAELLGHHLAQGFGTTKRSDLSLAWYDMALEANATGNAVFAPGQPERNDLIRKAAYQMGGRDAALTPIDATAPKTVALPTFKVD